MNAPRLKTRDHTEAIRATLERYERQHIKPLLPQYPVLNHHKSWLCDWIGEPFDKLIKRTAQDWIEKYPELTYQQLQQKAQQRQWTREEQADIEHSIKTSNQRLVKDNEKRNQDIQAYYKTDKAHYWKNPLKHRKPDKSRYKAISFSVSDSPFTVAAALDVLQQIFQKLHEEQHLYAFSYSKSPQTVSDQQQLTLHDELDKSTQALAQMHQDLQGKNYELQAKEAQLKREMEQLQRLTRLSQAYQALPETDDDLTSPSERIRELEALLAQKRKGG